VTQASGDSTNSTNERSVRTVKASGQIKWVKHKLVWVEKIEPLDQETYLREHSIRQES
jgi:hypothetical protein